MWMMIVACVGDMAAYIFVPGYELGRSLGMVALCT
jgi:hypothetical protein